MAHGWAKWSRGPEAFAKLLQHVQHDGVPLPQFAAWVVTLPELFGGLAILAGAFVAVVSLPLVISMLLAMFKVRLPYPLGGPASLSVDGWLARRRELSAESSRLTRRWIPSFTRRRIPARRDA
jgi:putative oxidoreductase